MTRKLTRSAVLSMVIFTLAAPLSAYVDNSWLTSRSDDRSDYVSDASFIVGTYEPKENDHSPQAMVSAAKAFLESLSEEMREQVTHDLDSPERRLWTNLPAPADAGGVRLGNMTEAQVKAACDLMATMMSDQGYQKMCNIMLADDQLLRGGRARPGFGTEYFSVVLFGEPSTTEPWGFQLDGHHVGVNVAIEGRQLTMSPSFIGTQPEAFAISTRDFRPLGNETDLAYQLMGTFKDEQLDAAIVGRRRGRIVSGPGTDGRVPTAKGVSCESFDKDQREILMKLISQWVNDLPEDHAKARMEQLNEEIDEMRFAWNGPTDAGSDISYSIQGPSLIIEYACQDLGGNPLDHLHTMYRDPTNEYGGQLDE